MAWYEAKEQNQKGQWHGGKTAAGRHCCSTCSGVWFDV